jgi:hypothetical protein
VEVIRALAFTFVCIAEVRVMCHHDHQPSVVIGDATEVWLGAVSATLGRQTRAGPQSNVRNLGHFLYRTTCGK